jgi:hypothetical protein
LAALARGRFRTGGVIEGDFIIQPSAGETTREQMGVAMWELRKMARGSAGFRRG